MNINDYNSVNYSKVLGWCVPPEMKETLPPPRSSDHLKIEFVRTARIGPSFASSAQLICAVYVKNGNKI